MNQFKVTAVDRILGSVAPGYAIKRMATRLALHQFQYDAARATTQRRQAPQNINPNDFQKQRDRLQLMREAEDIENNFAPAKTLNRKYAMYVAPVGYDAQTGDSKLDKDIEVYLNEIWFPSCDITERYDFFQMMEFGVIGKNRGGDYGWAFMRPGLEEGMSEEDAVQLPLKIQAVEPDRIGGIYQNVVAENYIGGVIIGEYGEPVAYRVFKRNPVVSQYTDPVDVPSDQFVHYTDPLRLDMYRGVSMLDTASMPLRDLYEWIEFLKAKSKVASALTIFTNSNGATVGNGALDPYQITNFANNQQGLQQDIHYGQINYLPTGSDVKFPDTTAPGTESQYLQKLLMKFCAWSYNLPHSFALDATDLGGVSGRLESEQAKAEFSRGQKVFAPKCHKIKNAALLDAIAKGYFPVKWADKIIKGRFAYRPHPQPDLGKEAAASISLYQNGLLDPLGFWRDQGTDAETVARDMSKWASIKKAAAAEYGNTVEEVFGMGPIVPGTQSKDSDGNPPKDPIDQQKTENEKSVFERLTKEFSKRVDDTQKDKNNKMSEVIRALMSELGYDQDRAIAAAYKIVEEGYFKESRLP